MSLISIAFICAGIWGLVVFAMLIIYFLTRPREWNSVRKSNQQACDDLGASPKDDSYATLNWRYCPNSKCGRPTIRRSRYCKQCGTELPLPVRAEDRELQRKFFSDSKCFTSEGCADQIHFIESLYGGRHCSYCGVRLEPKLVDKQEQ